MVLRSVDGGGGELSKSRETNCLTAPTLCCLHKRVRSITDSSAFSLFASQRKTEIKS